MTTSISDSGVGFASGNLINVASAMPTTGSFVAGDLVLENTTGGRTSGWRRLTTGSGNVLNTDWLYFSAGTTLGTSIATTSGTTATFTGIPSWARRITMILRGVSTSGTNNLIVQIGSGSLTTSGYTSSTSGGTNANTISSGTFTTGFGISHSVNATNVHYTQVVVIHLGSNVWQYISSLIGFTGQGQVMVGGGEITLGGVLDRVALTTVGSTDTFDAGSVNILYE